MALNKINDNNVSNPLTISTLRVDGTLTSSGSAIFTGGSQSTVGIISRQSQVTAGTDLQQWQQGDGFVWGRVTSQGEFQFGANGSTVRLGTNSGGAAALVVTSTSTAQVGAIIKGSAGITADVFQIQNSGGSVQVRVDSNFYAHSVGWILPSGSGAFEQAFGGALLQMSKTTSTVTSPAANTARIFVKDGTTAGTLRLSTRTGIAGVEEALIDNISSTGSTAGAQFVGAGGVLTTGTVSLGSGTYDGYNADSSLRLEFRGTAGTQRPYIELQGVGANDPANENGGAFIRFRTSRAAGYGADIGAVRKSGGASTLIFKTGVATLDAITQKMVIDENGNVLINGFASGTVGLTVRGASGQSVNLYEIQNNSSVLLGGMTSAGRLYVQRQEGIQFMDGITTLRSRIFSSGNNGLYFTTGGGTVNVMSLDGGSETALGNIFYPYSTDRYGLVVRGIGTGGSYTQTADLQQWQSFDGTTATTIAKVASNGVIFGAEVRTFNTQLVMREVAGGGNLYMAKATSAPGNPTANIGTLFYRDGTTAGTLKLATRTGASGVEETIVDNLSSTGSTAGAQFVGAGGVNTAGTLTSAGLILSSTTSPITLNGSVGTSGFVLTSAGAGATPTWTNPNLVNVNATAKTGAYTLATSDYGTMVQMNAAAAFTVGTGLYNAPVGTQITLLALVAGVTVAASGANVIVNATPGLKLRAQYSTATLICLSSGASACTWLLTGDLSA